MNDAIYIPSCITLLEQEQRNIIGNPLHHSNAPPPEAEPVIGPGDAYHITTQMEMCTYEYY